MHLQEVLWKENRLGGRGGAGGGREKHKRTNMKECSHSKKWKSHFTTLSKTPKSFKV